MHKLTTCVLELKRPDPFIGLGHPTLGSACRPTPLPASFTSGCPAGQQLPCGPTSALHGWWLGHPPWCAPPRKRCACWRWVQRCCVRGQAKQQRNRTLLSRTCMEHKQAQLGTVLGWSSLQASLGVRRGERASRCALGERVAAPGKRVLAPGRDGVLQGSSGGRCHGWASLCAVSATRHA